MLSTLLLDEICKRLTSAGCCCSQFMKPCLASMCLVWVSSHLWLLSFAQVRLAQRDAAIQQVRHMSHAAIMSVCSSLAPMQSRWQRDAFVTAHNMLVLPRVCMAGPDAVLLMLPYLMTLTACADGHRSFCLVLVGQSFVASWGMDHQETTSCQTHILSSQTSQRSCEPCK